MALWRAMKGGKGTVGSYGEAESIMIDHET